MGFLSFSLLKILFLNKLYLSWDSNSKAWGQESHAPLTEPASCPSTPSLNTGLLTEFWNEDTLQSTTPRNKSLPYKSYPMLIYDLSTVIPQLLPHMPSSRMSKSLCSNSECWRSVLTGQSFKHFANFIQRGKNKNFRNCCDSLRVNMTAVLTSGKSCLLSTQQKSCGVLNISESVHEPTVLELL